MLTTFVQGLKIYVMSENEFNLPLWNERFDNIRNDVEEIKKTVSDIGKLMILTIIGITGWAVVQLYAQVMTKPANAAVPVVVAKMIGK